MSGALATGCSNAGETERIVDAGVEDTSVVNDGGAELDAGGEPDLGVDAGPIDDPRQLPFDIRRAAPDLEVAMENNNVRVFIRRASTLSDEDIGRFLTAATSALLFNMNDMDFTAEQIALEPRVRVVVLDVPTYNAATDFPETYGISYPAYGSDGDAFVMPDNSFSNLSEMDDTLAHEINHILVSRRTPHDQEIPWWQVEGTAIDMGSHFGWEQDHVITGFIKPYIDVCRGSDATLTFSRFDVEDMTTDLGQLGHDQAVSGFFVEYLRFIHPHGAELGYPDVHARMLGTSVDASGGAHFADAFSDNFDGLDLADAKTSYAAFLEATRSNLPMRYAGTIFE